MTSLAHQLLGQTRSAVLGSLLLHPGTSMHVRELARVTGASAGSLHRELRFLAQLGLLQRAEAGRQVFYRANPEHPIFHELAQLLRKTSGLADVLRAALEPLDAKVDLAFVYGSIAAGEDRATSDVDLMVLGRATFADLVRATAQAQVTLRRDVNPAVMTPAEFADKFRLRDGFVQNVMNGKKLWLKGSDRDLAELAEDRATEGTRGQRRRSPKTSRSDPPNARRRRRQGPQR